MNCLKCGSYNPGSVRFCGDCGARLANRCTRCGADNPPGKRFCADCGMALAEAAPAAQWPSAKAIIEFAAGIHEAAHVPEGERKTVTALFADIKGSTELMEDLDPEEARAIVDPALRIMVDAVRRYEGYVVQSTGDGIFALFGAPAAYEDHPQRGLYAALQMQRELHDYGQRHTAEGQPPLLARVGVNTGEVVVRTVETGGKVEYTPIGHTANLAARLQTVAPAGSVAISEHTRKLVEGYFELRALGPMTLKGVGEPIVVYEVTGPGLLRTHFELAARRGLTTFVGRERELAQMRRMLELAISGQGQLVAIVAEPGAGKSRLAHEFKAALPPACKLLETCSVSHGNASGWLPVLELLRDYFGIQNSDDPAARRDKVHGVLAALDPSLSDALPYFFVLLGIQTEPDPIARMDPGVKRRRTLEALKRTVLRESLRQPLVIIFEDLHWIDAETQALLDLLADSVAGARILLLVNYRPEYRHDWSSRTHYRQLRLDPLGGDNAAAMLAALLGDGTELKPLKRLIIERTGGNPFFIEETVQALFDEGVLVRNGVVKVARSLAQLRLPPTVQGIIAARIDRLPAQHKELLQILAVIGREAPLGLITTVVSTAPAQLKRMLAELGAAEFIYEQPAAGDAQYIFKHALTQEVAYNSILKERRKLLHERSAAAVESLWASSLDDHLEELAHHYSRSDNVAKAVEYLGRAGQQALQRAANADAIVSVNAAIELLPRLPEGPQRIQRELFLQLALGQALTPTKGFAAPEVDRAFTRARGLCAQLGDPPELVPVLFGLHGVYFIRGDHRTAHKLNQQLLRLAEGAGDRAMLMMAHYFLGLSSFHFGEFLAAREHLEKAISLYHRERDQPLAFRGADALSNGLSYVARAMWHLGYPDQAFEKAHQGLASAQELASPFCLASAECFVGVLREYRREAHAAEEVAEHAVAFAAAHGFAIWQAYATILRGLAISMQGRHEDGIAQMREGLAAFLATGTGIGLPHYLLRLAQAYVDAGRLDQGLGALTEAMVLSDEQGDRFDEAETHRFKGELLLKQDRANTIEALASFQRAIEIARKQSAKSLELRATTSLARLLSKEGRHDEARAMLSEIYGWFTEGFDTGDLKDAKALLDALDGRAGETGNELP